MGAAALCKEHSFCLGPLSADDWVSRTEVFGTCAELHCVSCCRCKAEALCVSCCGAACLRLTEGEYRWLGWTAARVRIAAMIYAVGVEIFAADMSTAGLWTAASGVDSTAAVETCLDAAAMRASCFAA